MASLTDGVAADGNVRSKAILQLGKRNLTALPLVPSSFKDFLMQPSEILGCPPGMSRQDLEDQHWVFDKGSPPDVRRVFSWIAGVKSSRTHKEPGGG